MLKKLLGIGKNDFYMELKEDSKTSTPVAEKKPTAAKVETTAAPVAEKKPTAAKVEATAAPVAEKKPTAAKVEATATPVAKVETPKVATPKVSGFASTPYWNNSFSGTPRRLPSANMSGFLDLARQVKKPGA